MEPYNATWQDKEKPLNNQGAVMDVHISLLLIF